MIRKLNDKFGDKPYLSVYERIVKETEELTTPARIEFEYLDLIPILNAAFFLETDPSDFITGALGLLLEEKAPNQKPADRLFAVTGMKITISPISGGKMLVIEIK